MYWWWSYIYKMFFIYIYMKSLHISIRFVMNAVVQAAALLFMQGFYESFAFFSFVRPKKGAILTSLNCWGENQKDTNVMAEKSQRNLFEILLNQTEIRLYLPFSDWFRTANECRLFSVQILPENGKYNLISVWFNIISNIFLCVYRW